MLQDILHQCPIVKALIGDVSLGWVLKPLLLLHLTLLLFRDVCCVEHGSFPQSVRQGWGQLKHLQQRFTSNVGKNGQVAVLEGTPVFISALN